MKVGDKAFFYIQIARSRIVGLMEIASEAYTDHTAFDKDEKYFEQKVILITQDGYA
ncbi:MAG: hypothetical protein Ct9H90mP13_12360 [Pseudomonadota bacterium]|nr:MAG: hypothetical protein Ct9H90mP13_12360 [Pseudomonadota bacterium]